jgi:hypothetical protein
MKADSDLLTVARTLVFPSLITKPFDKVQLCHRGTVVDPEIRPRGESTYHSQRGSILFQRSLGCTRTTLKPFADGMKDAITCC